MPAGRRRRHNDAADISANLDAAIGVVRYLAAVESGYGKSGVA
jgi:hypothetical protein